MDNQESTSFSLNSGGHLPDGLFPHVLLRLREVKGENASLREDKAAKCTLIEKQQELIKQQQESLIALQTGHIALQTGHSALQTEHNALLTRHGALQTEHIDVLTRLRSLIIARTNLINYVNFGMVIVAIGMVLKESWSLP